MMGSRPLRARPGSPRDLTRLGALLGTLLALCPPSPGARADPEPPWTVGVPADRREAAQRLVRLGTAAYEQNRHAEALRHYQDALARWDHPAIRYNLAECLINLDRPVEAHAHLTAALRFGAAPFEARIHAQAQTYLRLLEGRLGRLTVTCRTPGAVVTLDGRRLVVAPGEATELLLPGDHQVVAALAGHLTVTRTIAVPAGRAVRVAIEPLPLRAGLTYRRRWPAWKPWVVIAAGAAVAAAGVPLLVQSASNFRTFDREVTGLCPAGCAPSTLPGSTLDLRDRARAEAGAAAAAFAAGGATALAGVVLALLNLPRAHRAPTDGGARVGVTPTLGPGAAGLTLDGRF